MNRLLKDKIEIRNEIKQKELIKKQADKQTSKRHAMKILKIIKSIPPWSDKRPFCC